MSRNWYRNSKTLKPRQNGRHSADNILITFSWMVSSLNVTEVCSQWSHWQQTSILVQILVWWLSLLTYRCVTLPHYIFPSSDLQSLTHYRHVIISAMASQITGVSTVHSTVCSGAGKRKKSKLCVSGLWLIYIYVAISLGHIELTMIINYISSGWRTSNPLYCIQ